MTDVAVVIANYNGAHLLTDCIRSLHEQTQPPRELVVVDAGSQDDSVRVATELGARILEVPNRGLGYLYNRGVEAVSSPFVLVTNNDVAFDDRCVELLTAVLEADEDRFAADPRQMDWDGTRLVHARVELHHGPFFHRALPGFDLDLARPSETDVPTVSANAGAMLVRRDKYLALGGFDETFFLDFEDLDLCWRAWLRGWPSVYVPDAWLRHRVGATNTSKIMPRRLVSSHHNLVRFALKCFPPRAAGRVVLGELLRLPRHPRLIVPAFLMVARELPEIARQRRAARPTSDFFDRVIAGSLS